MDDKAKRLEKLKDLLKLAEGTTNKGEAMAAIGRFHALSEKYGLTMEEVVNAKKDDFAETSMYSADRGSNYQYVDRFLWKAIAEFCGVKVGVGVDKDGDLTLKYFGLEAEVMEAVALRATIKAAMKFEWSVYRDFVMASGARISQEMEGFHRGFADECRQRMDERTHEVQKEATSYALVIKKWEVVSTEAAARGFQEAQAGRASGKQFSEGSYAAGQQAGGRVRFGTSVGNGGTKMIGK